MLVRPKQWKGWFSTRVMLGNEEVVFVEEFRYLGHVMTADCRAYKDIKKQLRRQNVVSNMLVRKFSCVRIEAKIQLFKSYCYPIYWCALWRHSFQNSIRKLTVSYRDTLKHLINVPRYTSSNLALAVNANDHIKVMFRKFVYSLMSRVTASTNSVITAIVNVDAYSLSPLMDKWESMLYAYRNNHTVDRIISQYVNVWWMTM